VQKSASGTAEGTGNIGNGHPSENSATAQVASAITIETAISAAAS